MIPAIFAMWQYIIHEPNSQGQGGLFQTAADCLKEAQHFVLEKPADIECYQIGPTGDRIKGTTVRLHVGKNGNADRP